MFCSSDVKADPSVEKRSTLFRCRRIWRPRRRILRHRRRIWLLRRRIWRRRHRRWGIAV